MSLGNVMLDIAGTQLDDSDREVLRHPSVGGVILFSRNYEHPLQLRELVANIHALRDPPLLVGVDQEGGPVQRFRDEFTPLPPPARLGEIYQQDARRALRLARMSGRLMATELRELDVDLSFSPVLDLANPESEVLAGRAFHQQAEAVARLAEAWVHGMQIAGMSATGKHFPGHGWVAGDSHSELPTDPRALVDIAMRDLVPFRRLAPVLGAIMTAHVLYPQVDAEPPTYSRVWIERVLRRDLGFGGAVISDDLSMAGAAAGGTPAERAARALAAGCDLLLVCNDRPGALSVLDSLGNGARPSTRVRLARLHGRSPEAFELAERRETVAAVRGYG
ncbi:MAG: beta-N-acetylhexosaminidase [Gammaproteobacteria bacterium]|nr:beta-N-acetylhexosaminidase [Gammaproteobacteria bacterium]